MPRLCAFGCVPTGIVHRFPSYAKFPERFKEWVNLCGGKLETEANYVYYSKKIVCDQHFAEHDKNRNKRLNALAVPSLFIPGTPDTLRSEQVADNLNKKYQILSTHNLATGVAATTNLNVSVTSLGAKMITNESRQKACDDLMNNPALRTPPPEPERPRPLRPRIIREFKLPPRFPLLSKEFYASWCNHRKEMYKARHWVDTKAPPLYPELYLKPRRLDFYARQLEANMAVNKDLLKRINLIQRTGGYVDCWKEMPSSNYKKLLCKQRQRTLDEIQRNNLYFYKRLIVARSKQPLTCELDEAWKDTKHKLVLGATLPFILFKTEKIYRDFHDPAFDKPAHVNRTKVSMELWVPGGSKIGRVLIELFNDLRPKTCQLFLSLLRGDADGHAYCGTRLFRIVPNLYCRGGDVTKDNGFGCYVPAGEDDPMKPEGYSLKHSVPGVLSMVVNPENEVCGQFNIIFKPLPQFDGKHVVFGRIIAGPAQTLERISALGLPLGSTSCDLTITSIGYFTRTNKYYKGNPNTIKFPPRTKK